MTDETPLNGAQIAAVQAATAKVIEGLRLRQWAVEQCLKNGVLADKVVQLAAQITNFIADSQPRLQSGVKAENVKQMDEIARDFTEASQRQPILQR